MAGTLYFEGLKPTVGTAVMVSVDEANHPTGFWDGELVEVGDDDKPACYDGEWNLKDTRWVHCRVRLTDPRVPREYANDEPHLNYSVYPSTSGTQYLRKRLSQAGLEIRGLSRRLEIERSVWHAALKAIVSPEGFARFEKLLADFMVRLGR